MLLGDHQHAAGTATRIVDVVDGAGPGDVVAVAREHQVDHQVNHVARREVFARVLVECLVELPDEFLENRSHGGIVDLVGVEIDILEPLHDAEEEPPLVQHADRVPEAERLQHLPHVRAEPGDVAPQVTGQVWRVGDEALEVVWGYVIEVEARGTPKLSGHRLRPLLQLLYAEASLVGQHASGGADVRAETSVLTALEGVR